MKIKSYEVRIYLKKGSYPVQLDCFMIKAMNKTQAKLKAKKILKKNGSYPLSWYMININ